MIPTIVQKLPIIGEGKLRPSAEISLSAAQASPPVAVATGVIAGIDLQWWVLLLTAIYLLAQIGYLFWKWWREWLKARSPVTP